MSTMLVTVMITVLLSLFAVSTAADTDSTHDDHGLEFRFESYVRNVIIKDVLKELMKGPSPKQKNLQSCSCQNMTCGCCVSFDSIDSDDIVDKIKMKELGQFSGCALVTYLRSEIGLEVKVTIDGVTVLDEKISAKNPPPICVAIPHLHKLASVCLKVYDINIQGYHFSACLELDVQFAMMKIAHLKMGCFKIPPYADAALESKNFKNL